MRTLNAKWRALCLEADKAWSAALGKAHGAKAGDIRYTREGNGAPGSHAQACYVWFETMRRAHERAEGRA